MRNNNSPFSCNRLMDVSYLVNCWLKTPTERRLSYIISQATYYSDIGYILFNFLSLRFNSFLKNQQDKYVFLTLTCFSNRIKLNNNIFTRTIEITHIFKLQNKRIYIKKWLQKSPQSLERHVIQGGLVCFANFKGL